MNMKIPFQYKTITKKKRFAFSGDMMGYKSREEMIEGLRTIGRSYPGVIGYKMLDEFTKEELETDLKENIDFFKSHYEEQGVDVFNIFKKYFGISLYNVSKSECIKYPENYIKIFTDQELQTLGDDKYRNYWHHVCGYVHMCPRVATISFKKMVKDLEPTKEQDFWQYKITEILHKTFGDKETFFFSKWQYGGKKQVSDIELKIK